MAASPIRVLAVLEAYSLTSPARAVLEFAREAAQPLSGGTEIEVGILTFLRRQAGNVFTQAVRQQGLSLYEIKEGGRYDPAVLPRMRAAVARCRPHVIWTNAVKSHFLARAAGLHRRAKWVAFHHGYTTTAVTTRVYNQLDRWSLKAAARVVTVCRSFATEIESLGVNGNLIRVQAMPLCPSGPVPPGVLANVRRELGLEAGTLVLLSVGRLSREKGHADLLHAVAKLRQMIPALPLRLLLVGAGPELTRLQSLCYSLNLTEIVSFLGHQEVVGPYYALADVFVLPSHTEGTPLALLEAIEAGIPVVATSVGGVPEVVATESEALLVPRNDILGMASALHRLALDSSVRLGLANRARAILCRHTPRSFYESLAAIFREVVSA